MLDLDLTQEIAALRSTFRDIRAVVDVDALEAEIARLSEQAGAPARACERQESCEEYPQGVS